MKSDSNSLTVSPSLTPLLKREGWELKQKALGRRTLKITIVALVLGLCAGLLSHLLINLISLITNLSFYGNFSFEHTSPAANSLGLWVILVPTVGGLIIGLMAKFGSEKIRGHGIPEAIEQVLYNESRIPARMVLLKPLSSAISIGTGGPFGAEGPVIATGGAIGSLFGQFLKTNANERKTLLAAGAAAGLSATFGNPISSIFLAIELLLFEFTPRSLIPVSAACAVAAGVRIFFEGTGPAFNIMNLPQATLSGLAIYAFIGLLVGISSVWISQFITFLEHGFERLPIPWVLHPAIGGLVVGIIGWYAPQTMGPGYATIESLINGQMLGWGLVIFLVLKFTSWSMAVGSGTSGGTLAPMFIIGGCLAGIISILLSALFPALPISISVATLVGMGAIFAGASRAFLASILIAFETTHDFQGILPLLAGCTAAYLISGLMMKSTIMTDKFVRSGSFVPQDLVPNLLHQIKVEEAMNNNVIAFGADDTVGEVRTYLEKNQKLAKHQAYPLLNDSGQLHSFVFLRDLVSSNFGPQMKLRDMPQKELVTIPAGASLKDALDLMKQQGTGRLIVVQKDFANERLQVRGILTRFDIHEAYDKSHKRSFYPERSLTLKKKPPFI